MVLKSANLVAISGATALSVIKEVDGMSYAWTENPPETLGRTPHVTEGFRSIYAVPPEDLDRVTEIRSDIRDSWQRIPVAFAGKGPLSSDTIREANMVLSRCTGLLGAYPNLADENLIRMFDNFLTAEEKIGGSIGIPGAESIVHLAWSEFMNWRAPAHRVAGFLNEIARIGALMASGRRITAVGMELPEMTLKAWSTHLNRTDGMIRPKVHTLRPEVDAIEDGRKAIEIKNASLTKKTFRKYVLMLLEQGAAPGYPVRISEGERESHRQILSAIRFVNQLIYYRGILESSPLHMVEYHMTSVKRVPDSIISAAYGFMGDDSFKMIQYDHMFSDDGIVL
jgi:hypothetical protein